MQAPPIINSARPRTFWWLAVALPVLAAVVVLFLFNPSQYGFYPRCVLYTTTGLYCPGCGSQRALHQLTHGHLAAAFRCNALLMLSLPFAAVYGVRFAACWVAGKPLPNFAPRGRWILFFAALALLFTILRNIPYAPFTGLAPP